VKKELKVMLSQARADGWLVSMTRGSHWRLQYGSTVMFMASTPSDRRSLLNFGSQMRRAQQAEKAEV
jgi:hypothetical protein